MAQPGCMALMLQIETSEEELSDWADSQLFKFIGETHTRFLIDKMAREAKGNWFDRGKPKTPDAEIRGRTLTELDNDNLK